MANKAEREDYTEAPFFYRDTEYREGRLIAWAGDASAQELLFNRFVDVLGERLDYLLKVQTAPKDGAPTWHRLAGGILANDLKAVIDTDRELFFHDSGFQVCLRKPETNEYFAYDEHGMFWIYSNAPVFLEVLRDTGVTQRQAECICDKGHWHYRPKDARDRLPRLVEEFKRRSKFCQQEPDADRNRE